MFRFDKDMVYIDADLEPVEFWPYPSGTCDPILEMEFLLGDRIERLRDTLIKLFQEANFDCQPDNKIVFGVRAFDGPTITFYVGFKDGIFSIGTNFISEHRNSNRRQKKD